MNNLIYTTNGISKFKNNIEIIDENGQKKFINNIISNNLKNKLVYRIKINNTIDNIFFEPLTQILSIQNIPHDLKINEIPDYLDYNNKYSKISFNNIKNITDFDYICYPIINFNEDDNNENEFYRFLGICLMNNFSNNINLLTEENKNTIAFINKYLFNNNIQYEVNEVNEYNTHIKFNCPITNYDNKYNNLNKANSKLLLKGILELYYTKNNDNSYITIKLNIKARNIIYIIKFLLIKFNILISSNYIDEYYIIKIPKIGIVAEILNINKNYDNTLNYFIYQNYICTKIKSITKINNFNGYINTLENNEKYISEAGIVYHYNK